MLTGCIGKGRGGREPENEKRKIWKINQWNMKMRMKVRWGSFWRVKGNQ